MSFLNWLNLLYKKQIKSPQPLSKIFNRKDKQKEGKIKNNKRQFHKKSSKFLGNSCKNQRNLLKQGKIVRESSETSLTLFESNEI